MELPSSVIFGQFPSCRFTSLLAVGTPDDGFFCPSCHVSDPPLQAVPGKSRALALRPIEPTPCDWGRVPCELLSPLERFLRGKSVGKRTRSRAVHVVWDELHPSDGRGRRFDQFLPACRVVHRRAWRADLDKAPASQRLEGKQHTTGALALLGVIVTCGPARLHRYRPKHIAQELTGAFSKTEDGTSKIISLFVPIQDLVPRPHVVTGHFPAAPACDSPRFQVVFFRAVRTASRDRASMTWRSTRVSASHGRVQRPSPSGGAEQASMGNEASTLPSLVAGAPLRRLSWRAWARPPAGSLRRPRETVTLPTSHGWQISSSGTGASDSNKIRARVMAREDFLPSRTSGRQCMYSASLK